MKLKEIISFLESKAPPSLQEHYDNTGLITGEFTWECTGVICTLDVTEDVVKEAIEKKCNLIVAHHPIIFGGLKKINGKNYVEKTIIAAIKKDIAIYAIHTNLDNIISGVNGKIAELLGLKNISILLRKENTLKKLFTYVPVDKAEPLRKAIFAAGAGHIGNYSECSFNTEGIGTFKAGAGTNPYVGNIEEQHHEKETRIEVIFPAWLEANVIAAMNSSHPYEEIAYEIVDISNDHQGIGSGIIGYLPAAIKETDFLSHIKQLFNVPVIRHTRLLNKPVQRVAVCGGAGSFLVSKALAAGADVYITADMKYHEFFDANDRMVITDIGHFESEQFTIDLLKEILEQKFPTFAVLKTSVKTNPVKYFV
ncbi:MAG: Nif3-like dinuclear metal center hexameric protein [Bacteroidetes bacterium]|nr:Nif3-like dinuclear metal center hexameric protein [Bacteroidota bacterium]MBS1929455.1 Nif3-like dinuclear metal center hexameric protein [Bacteroidota bacterium]